MLTSFALRSSWMLSWASSKWKKTLTLVLPIWFKWAVNQRCLKANKLDDCNVNEHLFKSLFSPSSHTDTRRTRSGIGKERRSASVTDEVTGSAAARSPTAPPAKRKRAKIRTESGHPTARNETWRYGQKWQSNKCMFTKLRGTPKFSHLKNINSRHVTSVSLRHHRPLGVEIFFPLKLLCRL